MLGLLLAFVLPCLFVTAAWIAARSDSRGAAVCGIAFGGIVVAFPFLSLPLYWTSVAMLLVGLVLGLTRSSAVVFRAATAAILAVVFAVFFVRGLYRLHELQITRRTYPVQSLAGRLAYETKHAETTAGEGRVPTSSEVERNLIRAEEQAPLLSYRQMQLKSLHALTTDEFIMSPGFGVGRMRRVSHVIVGRPENPPIPQPVPTELASSADATASLDPPVELRRNDALRHAVMDAAGDMHRRSVADFLSPERFGYVKSREHVVGFEPHQLASTPQLSADVAGVENEWRIARLELVGLLKHDEPRVYVSPYLPRMDELQDAPSRPLDNFEMRALVVLRNDTDTVVDERPDVLRMLGSLRADKSCLECHLVRRGELLGAFSYELLQKRPAANPRIKTGGVPAT